MDSFDFNKMAGGVLSALLLAFGAGTLTEMFEEGHEAHADAKPGYALPVTGGAAGAEAKPEEAFKPATVLAALKTANPENGQDVFKRCTACHAADKEGKPGPAGPDLYGIVGRPVGSSPTFPRYSAAMKGKGGTWTFEHLANYIHDPKAEVPGNQMAFAGIKNNAELADLLAYLRTLSDKPVALP